MASTAPLAPRVQVDDDRIIGGVAGHLARSLGVDPLWTRLGFVLLTLAGGVGALLYVGLWLVLSTDRVTRWRWQRVVGGAILVAGVPLLVFVQTDSQLSGPLAVVLLLGGLAAALWRGPTSVSGDVEFAAPPSAAPVGLASPGEGACDTDGALPPPSRPPRPPRRRREPSLLGRTTLGVAIAVAAIGALIDQANGGRLHPEQWLGAAAVVCGVGLLVGAMRGRGRWLIVPALLFAGAGYVAGTAAQLGIVAGDGLSVVGGRSVWIGDGYPTSHQVAHAVFGDVDVQVHGRPLDDATVTVDARTAFGDVRVWVDQRIPIEVRGQVDDGDVLIDGQQVDPDGPVRVGPAGEPAVVIDARVGHGDVRIDTYTVDDMAQPVDVVADLGLTEGSMIAVSDGVMATTDGWFVLGGGAAVIDDQDQLVVGDTSAYQSGDGWVATPYGEFRLLPRGLLLTPMGAIVDLHAVRAEIAQQSPTPTTTVAPTTDPASAPVVSVPLDDIPDATTDATTGG